MKITFGSVAAVVGALSCLFVGCEAITARDGLQCQVTADCEARGPGFADTICSSGLCEKIVVPEASTASGCTDSESCVFSLGATGRCISGQCVSFSPSSSVTGSTLCTTYGPVADDSAVLLGVLVPFGGTIAASQALGIGTFPTGGGNTGTIVNQILSVWNTKAASETPPAPTFAAVVCDELDLDGATAFFEQVKPAFVVGPYADSKLSALLGSSSTTPLFSPLGDGSYLKGSANHWYCSPNRSFAVPAFRSAVDLLAKYIASSRGKSNVTVQLIEDGAEPTEAQFSSDVVAAGFTFNGETINGASDAGAPVFQQIDISAGSSAVNIEDTTSSPGLIQANMVISFVPDLVIITGSVWAPSLLAEIEGRWSAKFGGKTPPPYYLAMHASPALATFAQGGSELSLQGRLFALDSDRSEPTSDLNSNYQAFQAELSVVGINEPYGGAQYSDCMTLGMYGVVAAGSAATAVSANQLSLGVTQITQQIASERGDLANTPDAIGNVLTLLANKQSLELVGTSAYYGLDVASGMPALSLPSPMASSDKGHSFALECAQTPPNAAGWAPAGVFYDQSSPGVPSSTTIDCAQ